MNKFIVILLSFLFISVPGFVFSQCSLCTKTAQQLGEKPALGMNQGILYLMLMPFAIIGYIGFRWWKSQRSEVEDRV